jgi:hypothetical protein
MNLSAFCSLRFNSPRWATHVVEFSRATA